MNFLPNFYSTSCKQGYLYPNNVWCNNWIHFWSLNFNYVSDIYFDMSVFFSKRSRFRISSQFSKIAFSSCFIIYWVPTVFRGLQLMLKTQAVCSDQTVIWKQCLYIWSCPQFSAYTLVLLKGPQHTDMMCVLVFNIIHSFVSSLNPHLLRICSVQSPMWSSRDIQMKTTWPFSNKGVIFWDINYNSVRCAYHFIIY